MSSNESEQEFSKLRAILFPVHNYELKKFIPMGMMMLCILFIYTLVRDLKDTLIVSRAIGGGAECISFLKLWGVTPSALLCTVIFIKLANKFEREKLFYVIVTFFLSFFIIFGFVLYPLRDVLHMSAETMMGLQQNHPHLHWFIPVIGNWSYSLFYIMAELWGSLVLTTLFWQFANAVTKIKEAKRFYSLFGFIGNFGLLASGSVIILCSKMAKISTHHDTFGLNLRYQMGAVAIFGLLLVVLYRWVNKKILTDPKYYNPEDVAKKKKKLKMSLKDSLKMILSSKYILLIAALILSYGISINLIEGTFKGQIKMLYSDPNDYSAFMGHLSLYTGALTILVMLAGSNILRMFSWRTAALITPIFMLILGTAFFGIIFYENVHGIDATILGVRVLEAAVVTGLIQNIFSKGIKYSLFDSTMQMAYIPLGEEEKVKGQAAVSLIGGRMGKSGGAFIQWALLTCIGGNVTLYSLAGVLSTIVLVIVLMWILSVCRLSPKFEQLLKENKAE